MGWLYPYHTKTRADLVKHLRAGYNTPTHKILRSQCVGNHFWALCESTPTDGPVTRYILLCLLQGPERDNPGGTWGHKDMDESAGPYYYDCPLSYLDLATEPINDAALIWREKVRAHHSFKAKIPRPVEGLLVTYGGQQYRLTHCLGRRGWEVVHAVSGVVYRMKLAQVSAALAALAPTE